ncbi:unnamed protein product [Schistosoma curassoni]|uniref:Uncharacterized protein n=1 Tax=Schistosoma curassoni TaxID=6186 RepID=A0A183K3L0_9TREM|nr:unnamed protein product [Schistosoma curassoni]
MRRLYDTTNKFAGNYLNIERSVKSKGGKVITNIKEQRNRWVEQSKELLNRPDPPNPPNIESAPTDLPIDIGLPTTEEISMAIRQIKSGKVVAPDRDKTTNDQSLVAMCTSCANRLDIALSYKLYKQRWTVASSGIQFDARFVLICDSASHYPSLLIDPALI